MILSELSPKIRCDAADERFRSPLGALPAGTEATLAFADDSGAVLDAEALLFGDEIEQPYEMGLSGALWTVRIPLPARAAALWYCFRLHLADGELWLCADAPDGRFGALRTVRSDGFRLTVYEPDFATPAWWRRAVLYQIFPDRFARDGSDTARSGVAYHRALGRSVRFHESWSEPVAWQPSSAEGYYFPDDFYGGTLRGIEERLPYLQSLGVRALYLNPVFEACSNHRYDTADYRRIDPILGTEEDFSRLCAKAAEAGIRILLDGVFSHTGADSVYFNRFGRYPARGAHDGPDSPYYSWYDFRKFPDDYRCWWNFADLPEVDEENPRWQDYVVTGRESVVRTWLARGASGWRLDVADELPDDVIALIRRAAREEKPDSVILGEVWEDPIVKTSYGRRRAYALGGALDSVMNYPLRTALLDFFTFRSDARRLSAFLLAQRLDYPAPLYYALMNLLSSHDVERLRTVLATRLDARSLTREQQADFRVSDAQDARGARMQRLCAAVQFALPGVPSIYYGDEAGMNGMLDPFDRAPFAEGARPLTDWYRELSAARSGHDALSVGAAAFSAPDPDILCVLRCIRGGRDVFGEPAADGAFLLCVNRAAEPRRAVADLWLENAGLAREDVRALRERNHTGGACLLTGRSLRVSDGLAELDLPPETACLFELT